MTWLGAWALLLAVHPFEAAAGAAGRAGNPSDGARPVEIENVVEDEKDDPLRTDWASLARYREENAKLGPPAAGQDRVVFMGDSITDAWGRGAGKFFPGKPYVNRGISGQTTPQMLVRFRQDVIDLKPKVVVILAGTNDIAGNTGPTTVEAIEGNIRSMAELARANGIRVVLASVLPARDFPWHPGLEPAGKVVALNARIKDYAAKNGIVYLDYHTPMADEHHGMKAGLSSDGIHPNDAGYAIMAPLAEKAIAAALGHPADSSSTSTAGEPRAPKGFDGRREGIARQGRDGRVRFEDRRGEAQGGHLRAAGLLHRSEVLPIPASGRDDPRADRSSMQAPDSDTVSSDLMPH